MPTASSPPASAGPAWYLAASTATDFSAVIARALALPGFAEDAVRRQRILMTGFGRNAVLAVADKVIEAVKSGAVKHFFLVGGCDGAKPGRNYYTELVEQIPADCMVLTLACGKFRFNDKQLGDIGGIPRLLDMGQCNDAYSAIQVAVAVADALGVGVNDLPLHYAISWFEQKATAVFRRCFHPWYPPIHLQSLHSAASIRPVLGVLVKFDIRPTGNVEEDLGRMLEAA